MDLRKLVDLTPWDKNGYSWMGLTREQSKFIATMLIFTGLFFADPPFSVLPFDFANIWLAGGFSKQIGLGFELSLLLTYTIWAWGLVLLGVWIYPYDSRRLMSGYINKFKRLMKKAFRNPIYLIIGLGIFYFMFQWYRSKLETSIPTLEGLNFLVMTPTGTTTLFVFGIIIFMLILRQKR